MNLNLNTIWIFKEERMSQIYLRQFLLFTDLRYTQVICISFPSGLSMEACNKRTSGKAQLSEFQWSTGGQLKPRHGKEIRALTLSMVNRPAPPRTWTTNCNGSAPLSTWMGLESPRANTLGVSMQAFPQSFNWSKKTHPECGSCLPMDLCPRMNKKEVSWALASNSLRFPACPSSHAFPTNMIDGTFKWWVKRNLPSLSLFPQAFSYSNR